MFSTYRAIVDDEGTIRLLEQVKLKEGTHILVTVADRDTLIWLIRSKTQPTQNNLYPRCLCGCGKENNPGSRFKSGHDAKLKATFSRIKQGRPDAGALPDDLIDAVLNNPSLEVVNYTGRDILEIAGENRGVAAAKNAYRAIVDGKSIIRLLKPVNLEEGTHILVTVTDREALIAPMRSSGQTALSEERLREELEEDEAWAYLLKDVPS